MPVEFESGELLSLITSLTNNLGQIRDAIKEADATVQSLAGAPVSAAYVVAGALDSTLTGDRLLTGTSREITVTDGGAGGAITLSLSTSLLAKGIVRKTDVFTDATGGFVDVTDLEITITTGANRVLLLFNGSWAHSTAVDMLLAFNIDTTDTGTLVTRNTTTDINQAGVNMHYLTDVLTAASHTFKVRVARGASGTVTLDGSTDMSFSAIEILGG